MILSYDKEEEKVSLGLKQKTPDPWELVEEKYPVSSKVEGKVVSITDYGAFVELETGVEGLVHISEMSWTKRVKHPSKVVELDDTVEAIVLDLDKQNRRISLGLKQIEPNPWAVVAEKYPPGSIVNGIVRNLTDFGAFIELEEGVDGLVHISDMSWTTRIKHPSEVLKKGEEVQAVLLNIDVDNERLSLGIKQLQPNPWEGIANSISVGENVTGRVVRLTDFGAFIELDNGVEGLLHVSEISRQHVKKPEDVLSINDEITAKVIKLDEENRRIGLSIKAYEEEIGEGEASDSAEEAEAAPTEAPGVESAEVEAKEEAVADTPETAAVEAESTVEPEESADAEAEASEAEPEAEAPQAEAEPEAEAPQAETEPEAEAKVESPQAEAEPEAEPEAEAPQAEAPAEAEPEAEPEAEASDDASGSEEEPEPETAEKDKQE
jgi:small subunit ribosomal protein S1